MGAQARGSAVAVALLVALLVSVSRAAQYTVGDTKDWDLQVDYTTWAAKYKFKTGDTLLFKYSAEEHDVEQVSAADYQSCNLGNAIKTWDDGNTVISLPDATTYYFVCGTPSHCTSGMKVAVSVLASTAAPPPSSATPPSATPPPATPPVTPPPAATPPPVSPPPAPLSSPPSSSPPAPAPPSSATASSPTPSPVTLTPTPSSSPAPSPTTTPASSSSPSAPPTSSPPAPSNSSTQPAAAPGSSNAYSSLTAQAVATISAAAFVGALLL